MKNTLKQKYFELLRKAKWRLGYVPLLSGVVFKDANGIYAEQIKEGILEELLKLTPIQRSMLHHSYGTFLRNRYLLWHPNNPHTSKRLEGVMESLQGSSPWHPDNYSWSVISRLIVEAEKRRAKSEISKAYDTAEGLSYSLLLRADDSVDTLDAIRDSVETLARDGQANLLTSVFEEALELQASPAKLKELLNAAAGYEQSIDHQVYIRVARRAVSYGISVPTAKT